MGVETIVNPILQKGKLRFERGCELAEVTWLVSWKSWDSLRIPCVLNHQIVSTTLSVVGHLGYLLQKIPGMVSFIIPEHTGGDTLWVTLRNRRIGQGLGSLGDTKC